MADVHTVLVVSTVPLLLLAAAVTMTFFPRRTSGQLQGDGEGVRFNAKLVAATHDLQAATKLRRLTDAREPAGWEVALHSDPAWVPVVFLFSDEKNADNFIRSLNLPDDRALSVCVQESRWPVFGFVASFLLAYGLFAFESGVSKPLALLCTATACLAVLLTLGRTRLVIGRDGIFLRMPALARMRALTLGSFIPFEEMRPADQDGDCERKHLLVLRLARGRDLSVPVPQPHVLAAIDARILRELSHRATNHRFDKVPGELKRQGRTTTEWVHDLRHIGSTILAQYRVPAPSVDEVRTVVQNPTLTASERIAAAIALHSMDPHQAEIQVRLAAGATANPRLRVAFEIVAKDSDDDAKLQECFESLAKGTST